MMPLTRIGPLALSSFGLTVLLAFWVGTEVLARLSRRADPALRVGDWLPLGLFLAGLAGARLWYGLFNLDLYLAQPRLIVQLTFGSFAFPGALLAAGCGVLLYARITHQNLLPWTDLVVRILPWAQALGMVGLLLSGEGYGRPTSLPWRIHLLGVDRHPSQIYEALALILLGLWLWRSARRHRRAGLLTAQYLGGYGAIRVILEPLRGDSLRLGSLRVAQGFGLIVVLVSLHWWMRRSADTPLSVDAAPHSG